MRSLRVDCFCSNMARYPVLLLSISMLSSVVPSRLLHSDAFSKVMVTKARTMCSGALAQKAATHLDMLTPGRASISVKTENILLGADEQGSRRSRLADAIAQEFDARVRDVRRACDLRLEHEKAVHMVELAEQRVELLKGMVPQAAHEAVVTSYEEASAAALKQVADSSASRLSAFAEDFSKREETLCVRVAERDASLEKATSDLMNMAESLACLKQSVGSVRSALRSHVSRAKEAREAAAREIRKNEVEPQRRRASAAETDLSELRQAAHGWLAVAHTRKLEAVADARFSGFAEGQTRGREEVSLKSEAEIRSLKQELVDVRQVLSEQLSRSRRERQILREEVVDARDEAVEILAAVGSAGVAALHKSREVCTAKGRAEGFGAGLAEGKAVGREEGIAIGRTDSASEMRAEAEAASEAEAKLRETLAAYMERISEVGAKRDSALGNVTAAASTDVAKPLLALPVMSPRPANASAATVRTKIYPASRSFFWQECGGAPR